MAYPYQSSHSFPDYSSLDHQVAPTSSNTYSGEFTSPHSYMMMTSPPSSENPNLNISPGSRYYPPSTTLEYTNPESNYPTNEPILTPAFPISSSLPESHSRNNFPEIYEVHFKRTMDLFVRGYTESFKLGDFVKVEADRGFDLGVIAVIIAPGSPSYPYHSIPRRRVLSLANDEEKAFLLAKIEEEYRALDICRELAGRRQMKINLLDAELQFDRRKLTFLFTSEKHTDFRELVRDLFSIFKTRIWMQKINPAQAASLEEDLKNSRFPTLPMNLAKNRPDKYSVESPPFDSTRYTMGSPTLQVSPPTSSPTRRPDLMEMSQMSQPQQHPHRSSSITSTGSASTYEEEDEEEAYLAERARRVGGIRGIREGENITISYAGTAANRSGIRSLGALNLSKAGPQSGYPRMAYSLPHGLEAQAVYSLGNNSEFLSRPNSNNSERALYELNNSESGRSISLPTALPSHHWSSHPEESTSTTNASNSVSSVENIYHRDLTHYAGIPITSRQLKHFEMQQQRYLTEKYSHSLPDFPETHLSEGPEADSLSHIIDGIHISLPNIQESNDKVLNSNYYPRQAPPPPPPPPLSYTTSTARRNYHPIDMTIQNNPNYDTNNSHY